jgi:predicted transcriptional regulator
MDQDAPDDTVQISAVIPVSLQARLGHAAVDLKRSRSSIIAEALESWLNQHQL